MSILFVKPVDMFRISVLNKLLSIFLKLLKMRNSLIAFFLQRKGWCFKVVTDLRLRKLELIHDVINWKSIGLFFEYCKPYEKLRGKKEMLKYMKSLN